MDKIYAIIPTMPSRLKYLERAVNSLLPQVDTLYVYFNNMKQVPQLPAFLDQVLLLTGPDRGSEGRFAKCADVDGYYAMCDDDLEYPNGYIDTLLHKVDEYGKKAVITFHGRIMDVPIISYRGMGPHRTKESLACLADVPADKEVMIGGTGVMMFHTDTIRIHDGDLKERNTDDTEFSVLANSRGIPIIVAAHKKGWIKYLNPPMRETIWYMNRAPELEKKLVNQVNGHAWKFPLMEGLGK